MSSLHSLVDGLFSTDGFVPRRICGTWPGWLLWEHIAGNALVWVAYLTIPILIWRLGARRLDWRPFTGLIGASVLFIALCGVGHFLEMLAFFRPLYRLSGHVLIMTGVASWWTVWWIRRDWPAITAMKGPAQFERVVREKSEEMVAANADLLARGDRFHQLADAMPQLAWMARADGHIYWYNRGWYDYTGTTPEQMEGWGWQSVHDPVELPKVLEFWKGCIATGEPFEMVFPIRGADGLFRRFLTRISPIRDDDGRLHHWFGTNTDIEDQKRAEEALRQSEAHVRRLNEELEHRVESRTAELASAMEGLQREVEERRRAEAGLRRGEEQFRILADSIPQLAWMARPDGFIFWYNRRWYDYTGTTLEQMQGWGWQSVHDPAELPRVVETIKASYASGEPWDCTFPLRRYDGAFRWFLTRMLPLKDEHGRVTLWFGSNTDVTEQKEAESLLRQAKESAESATRAKSDFLANMSHEIRTPMNGVIGMTELLLDTQLNDIQRDYAETIRTSGEALLTVINDILDFSKIEAGKLNLDETDFDLHTLMEGVADLLAPRAQQKGLEITCRIAAEVPGRLRGDPVRIRQVLTNLAGNSVKFTDQGEVNLEARVLEKDEDKATLRILVRDTGIGIPEDRQDCVFDSFTQIEGGNSRPHGGTGLGLTICRKLIDLMGGGIGLESRLGVGSIFWIELTLAAATGKVERPTAGLDGLRVLVIDDHETNRTILREILDSWGCRPTSVRTAGEALDALSASEESIPHDVAIINHHMPGLNADQAARAVKSIPRFAGLPIVLVTSVGLVRTIEQGEDELFVSRLTRPIHRSQLHNVLYRSIASPGSNRAKSPDADLVGSEPLVPLRVLLAEDNPVNRKVAIGMVKRFGYAVDVAENGQEAIEMIDSNPYDLVLMDVQMPVMDGLTATAVIREGEKGTGRHVPIIAMTAHAMIGDREKCLAAGMDDYLTKPLRPGPLQELICIWGINERNAKEEARPDDEATGSPFDHEAIRETCGDDPEVIRDLLEMMHQTVSEQLKGLEAAIAAQDVARVVWEAHRLKGSFLAGCAADLAATSQMLMELGAGADFPAIREAHRLVLDQWDQFQQAVGRYIETLPNPALAGVARPI